MKTGFLQHLRAACAALAIVVALCGCSQQTSATQKAASATAPTPTPAAADGCRQPASGSAGAACLAPTSPDNCKVCVRENPVLEAGADGRASSVLQVCNFDTVPHRLALSASDFSATGFGGRTIWLNTTRTLAADRDADRPIVESTADLAVQACVKLRLEVGKLSQAARMSATLNDGPTPLAMLSATRVSVPFALKMDGPNPEKLDISFYQGQTSKIPIRNDDPIDYRFQWTMELGDIVRSGVAEIRAKGLTALEVALGHDVPSWPEGGFLRPAQGEGRLTLRLVQDDNLQTGAAEPHFIPIKARLNYYTEIYQGIFNVFWVFFLLLVGTLMSLVINYALPMQRRRVAFKQSLSEQESALNGQGNLIGSRTLNSLRVELSRLRAAVDAASSFLPETAVVMPRLEARIAAVTQRIRIANEASRSLAELKNNNSIALHEGDAIADECTAALRIVELASPGESDLQSASAHLAAAAAVIAASNDTPDASAVAALVARANKLPIPLPEPLPVPSASSASAPEADLAVWKDLNIRLGQLSRDFLTEQAAAPGRGEYVRASEAVWKAEAIANFAWLVATAETPAIYRQRLDRAPAFLDTLTPGPNESALSARLLLREVDQNISKADVLAAISGPDVKARIEVDPPAPTAYQITTLRVRLPGAGLDASDARRAIACRWKVDGVDLEGEQFAVAHFFEERRRERVSTYQVEVALHDGPTVVCVLAPKRVTLTSPRSFIASSTLLSVGSLAVTVVIVTIGLLTAAQEKLQALNWASGVVTLLALGFGADVVKRALTKSSSD